MPNRRLRLLTLALLAPIAVTLLLVDLGRGSLVGNEALYGSVVLDTRESGRPFPLVVDGQPYVAKPVGGFLLMEVSMRLLGSTELAVRLPSALVGLLLALLVGDAAARWFGGLSGVVAGVVTISAEQALKNHGFRSGTFESLLVLSVAAIAVGWVELHRSESGRPWRIALAASAGSSWIKYLAGPGLAATGVLLGEVAFAARREHGRVRAALARLAQLLGAGVFAYLVYLLLLRTVGVRDLWHQLVELDLVRRATGGLARRASSPGVHLDRLVADFRWVLLLLLPFAWGLGRRFRQRAFGAAELAPWVGAAAWTAGPLLAISLFGTRHAWYVVSVLPGLGLALAAGLAELRRLRVPAALVAALALVVVALRVEAGLRVARSTDRENPLRFVPAALDEIPGARFFLAPDLDVRAAKDAGIVRPQTAFYVKRLGARAERGWPPADAGCAAVLFDRRDENRPPEHLRRAPRFRFPNGLERGAQLYSLMDACDGRIAARVGLAGGG